MKAKEFVENFHVEKNNIIKNYLNDDKSEVALKIKGLELSPEDSKVMGEILDDVVNDVLYTILLGLGGSASIGKTQVCYKIFDENGGEIDSDEIEEHAWEFFQDES